MILITGGAGFIGSCLVKRLNKEGNYDIIICDFMEKQWKNLLHKKFIDIINPLHLLSEIKKYSIDCIVHLGANSSTLSYNATTNYDFSKMICDYAVEHKIPFIYASSGAVYGNTGAPLNNYGYGKYLFDIYANRLIQENDKIVGLRFFNVFGPNEYHKGNMASLVYQKFVEIESVGYATLFNVDVERDFIYVKDVVEVITYFIENPISGIYDVGHGKAIPVIDMIEYVFMSMGLDTRICYDPIPDTIKEQYQYYTQAKLKFPKSFNVVFWDVKSAVNDYVTNYLIGGLKYE